MGENLPDKVMADIGRPLIQGDTFKLAIKLSLRTLERMDRIVALSRRRDRILQAEVLDRDALIQLAADYEVAGMLMMAEDLRRRLDWYRSGVVKGEEDVERK
jgi:hypothetical protein